MADGTHREGHRNDLHEEGWINTLAEIAFCLTLLHIFRDIFALLDNLICEHLSNFWMRIDEQDSQACVVFLRHKCIVEGTRQAANDGFIVKHNATLQLLLNLLNGW